MIAMRYCKSCLVDILPNIRHVGDEELVVLRVPVEDEWGMLFTAHQAMKAGELRRILANDDAVIDLSRYSTTLRIEDVRHHLTSHFTTEAQMAMVH